MQFSLENWFITNWLQSTRLSIECSWLRWSKSARNLSCLVLPKRNGKTSISTFAVINCYTHSTSFKQVCTRSRSCWHNFTRPVVKGPTSRRCCGCPLSTDISASATAATGNVLRIRRGQKKSKTTSISHLENEKKKYSRCFGVFHCLCLHEVSECADGSETSKTKLVASVRWTVLPHANASCFVWFSTYNLLNMKRMSVRSCKAAKLWFEIYYGFAPQHERPMLWKEIERYW